jgi:hypothetical protein
MVPLKHRQEFKEAKNSQIEEVFLNTGNRKVRK